MLSQGKQLSLETDGRYATDAELAFLEQYAQTFSARLKAYRAVQQAEDKIMHQTSEILRTRHPNVFLYGGSNLASKWKADTIRGLRYAAIAMLMDDTGTLHERFLLWFQSIMRAFGAQQSCDITYRVMQDVVRATLDADDAQLLCQVLELNREILGTTV